MAPAYACAAGCIVGIHGADVNSEPVAGPIADHTG
jgi:hypothetical protein